MIVVKKKMKKPLIVVILAASLVVFTVAAILLNTFLLADSGSDGGSSVLPDPEVLTEIGESVYAKNMIAYKRIERSQIDYINITTSGVDKDGGEYSYGYTFFKDAETSGKPFILEYTDKDGESYVHYPPIISEDAAFDINDLYAIDQNDQYKTPKLTYLCSAIGTLYFNERIKLSDDAAAREEELRGFGLSEDEHPLEIKMIYTDSNGEQKKHTILVGDKLISGAGYYFRVDGRDYVYTTYSSTLDYAFLEFSDYINPILTSAGLPQDNAFEPYLTTDFKQWKNTLYKPYKNEDEEMVYPAVIEGSDLVLSLITKRPDYTGDAENGDKAGGYTETKKKDQTFDLSILAKDERYAALINSFVGKPLGACDVSITLPNYSSAVDLAGETKYTYEVLSIEAVITSEGDKLSGTVTDGSLVKISYHLYKGDEKVSDDVFYGVIDLSSELVSQEVKSNLVGKSVGALDIPYTFVVNYDKSNTVSRKVEMVITDITGIEDAPRDENDELKVVVGCKVAVRCYILVDGEQSGAPYSFYFEVKENPTEADEKALTEALLGKTIGKNYNIKIDAYSIDAEIVADFTTYEIDEAKHFVTKEEIVSFEFQQASERDAYYGESLYINTMQNPQYKLYALNASSCEAVLRVFGGLLENASTSDGLVGIKTVDVVLTPEKMLKYGLYAHEIYFELPRGITAVEYNGNGSVDQYLDTLDDYQYLSTLGFTLYISEEDPITKNRYIASDLYDVVVEISGENFKFLDYSFVDFYARKSVFLMNIRDIEEIKTEFFMDDVQGTYTADLDHLERYVYNNKVYTKDSLTEEQLAVATKIDLIDVYVSESGTNIETALTRYLAEHGITATTLRELYGDKYVEGDSVGTDEYKEFIETLFYTSYSGSLTEDEKAVEGKLVMRMSVELYEEYYTDYKHSPVFDYVFEFYRISDRKVKVKLSMQYKDGTVVPGYEVSDFYISSFSFKKLVSKYFDLMNAKDVDSNVPFSEESVLG